MGIQKYVAHWVKTGKVDMARSLDDMAFEITAKCFVGATDRGHLHKLRTIMGGTSLFDSDVDPAMASAVRNAVLEMIDEELESEMEISGKEDTATCALDTLLEGGLNIDEMKID